MLDYGIDGGMQGISATDGTKVKFRPYHWVISLGPEIVDQTGRGDAGALDWRALNEGGTCIARGNMLSDRRVNATGDLVGTLTLISASGQTLGPYNARIKRFQGSRDTSGPNGIDCVVHILIGNLISTGTFPVPYVFTTQVVDSSTLGFGNPATLDFTFDTPVSAVVGTPTGYETTVDGVTWLPCTAATSISANTVRFTFAPTNLFFSGAWRITTATGITFANGGNAVTQDGAIG